ncbi:hypothetical protein TRFO_38005 [Tritrichomonas foetus]|uniref:UBX domain-containing protein n=1 Tax=Tritrichomonas foetus TaxID=1144522 RepID=A0A1J4J9I3_9EUKA|nr:hypothetical protein TRFO_38005 [Tritrichomonas foetus]|eukprot:OHS95846.1 hypothetical protein TRFO_38005 [Tritrichomonas foetus]
MPPNYNNAKRYDYKDKKDDSGDDDDDAEFVRKYGQHKSNDRKRDPTQKNEKNIFDFSDSSSDSVNFVEPRPTSNIRSKRNIYINEEPKNVALPPLPKTQQGHIKQQHNASKPITSKVKPALQPSSNPFQPAPQTKTSSAKQPILSFSNQMLKEEKEAPKYSSTGSNQADKMKKTSDTNTKNYRMNGVVVKTVPNPQSESAPKKTAVPQITTTKSVKSSTDKTSAAASILSPTVVPSTLFKQPATTITAKKLAVESNQPTTKPPSQVSAPKSSQLNITPSNSSTKSKSTLSSDIKSESASKPEQAVSSTPATSTITNKTLKTTSTVKQTTTTIEPYSTVQNPRSNINSNVKQVTDAVNDTSTKQKANIPPTIKQTIQDKPQLPPKQPSIQSKSQQVQKPLENKALASEPLEKPATIEEEQEKRRAELRAKLGHPTIEERMNDPRFKSPFVMPPPFVVTEEAKNIIDWNYKPPENSDTKTSAPKSIETKKPSIEIDWNYIPPSKEEIRRQKEEEKEKAMNKVKIDWSYQIPQENNSSSKNEKNEDDKKKIQHNNSTMNNEKINYQKTIIDWSYKANDKNNFITSERRKKNKEEEEMETKKRIMQQREILHRGKEEDERPIEAKPIEERINKSDILEKNKLNMEYERDTIIALCGALQPEPTNGIRIAVQLPSGERKMRKFDKNTLGEDVFFWIANNDELFNEDGKPKRYYIQNADRKFDVNLTLEEQGIIRATLLNIIYF